MDITSIPNILLNHPVDADVSQNKMETWTLCELHGSFLTQQPRDRSLSGRVVH